MPDWTMMDTRDAVLSSAEPPPVVLEHSLLCLSVDTVVLSALYANLLLTRSPNTCANTHTYIHIHIRIFVSMLAPSEIVTP